MNSVIMDSVGWLGAALLLVPYLLLSVGKVNGQSKSYQALNIAGSAALIVNSVYYGALPSAFVNIVWIFIGLTTLYAILNRQAKE